jgi:type II secretory pathway pseudopilin PulG
MRSEELLIILLVAAVVIVVPLIAIILSIVAIVKSRRVQDLQARVTNLEIYVRRAASAQQNQIKDASTAIPESVPRATELHSTSPQAEPLVQKAVTAIVNCGEAFSSLPPSATSDVKIFSLRMHLNQSDGKRLLVRRRLAGSPSCSSFLPRLSFFDTPTRTTGLDQLDALPSVNSLALLWLYPGGAIC